MRHISSARMRSADENPFWARGADAADPSLLVAAGILGATLAAFVAGIAALVGAFA